MHAANDHVISGNMEDRAADHRVFLKEKQYNQKLMLAIEGLNIGRFLRSQPIYKRSVTVVRQWEAGLPKNTYTIERHSH